MQAGGDDDAVEDALLTFECPQCAALDQARRDGVHLVPAFQPAVGLDRCCE
jgi:hypothetical protein